MASSVITQLTFVFLNALAYQVLLLLIILEMLPLEDALDGAHKVSMHKIQVDDVSVNVVMGSLQII
jgi:hypothetical protein